jgi:hypothetical protein
VEAGPQVLLDLHGSGTNSTENFIVAGDWDLRWSYDCTAGRTDHGIIPSGHHCFFTLQTMRLIGGPSSANPGVIQLGVKDQGVEHYHTPGTFYLEVEVWGADSKWTVTVIG